jgi:hypothetical protein
MKNAGTEAPRLIAFSVSHPPVPIAPSPRRRDWMDQAGDHWPNRCLPLLIANEAGWVLRNTHRFRATWDGGERWEAVRIDYDGDAPDPAPVSSHFGYGILTFRVPYLFRTPPGWNLLARGPANWAKDGVSALEGVVETDWTCATFTMNWKLTRVGHPVQFEEGEPYCMIVPQRRGELEAFRPAIRAIESEPEVQREVAAFTESRERLHGHKLLSQYAQSLEGYKLAWEGHYYRGLRPDEEPAPEHQTRLHLSPFTTGSP